MADQLTDRRSLHGPLTDRQTMAWVGFLIILGVLACIAGLFTLDVPEGAREPLLILVGALSQQMGSVVNYWYGTSRGSERKTDILASQEAKQ